MNDNLYRRILDWCEDDPSLWADVMSAATGSRFSIRIRTATGQYQLNIPQDGVERILLEREVSLSGEQQQKLADAEINTIDTMNKALEGLIASRSSLVNCDVESEGGGMMLRIYHPVYADGLTRHSFLSALVEIDHFHKLIEFWVTSLPPIVQLKQELDQTLSQVDQLLQGKSSEVPPVTPVERRCPKCNRPVPAGKKFCTYDGTRVV